MVLSNLFLNQKDPSLWDIQAVFERIEKDCPSATHRDRLESLHSMLKQVKASGSSVQRENAQRIMDNWEATRKKLTKPKHARRSMAQPGSSTSTTIHNSISVSNNYGNVVGSLTLTRSDSGSERSAKSWKSADPNPKRRQGHFYLSSCYSLDNELECTRYQVNNFDFASACRKYRLESIHGAQLRESMYDARIMALSYVFLLSSKEHCMLSTVTSKQALLSQLGRNVDLQRTDTSLLINCKALIDAYDDQATVPELSRLISSADLDYTSTSLLQQLVGKFTQWNSSSSNLKEEDMIKQKLQCFIDTTMCQIPNTFSSWSTYTMYEYSKYGSEYYLPDFVLFNDQLRSEIAFEFFVVEVKSSTKTKNKGESDLVRLGKQMKTVIDKLASHGVTEPAAVGILVRDVEFQMFKMTLAGRGIYVMVELCSLHLLRTPADLTLVPGILERFLQAKTIVERMVTRLYAAVGGQADDKKYLMRSCRAPLIEEPQPKKHRKSRR